MALKAFALAAMLTAVPAGLIAHPRATSVTSVRGTVLCQDAGVARAHASACSAGSRYVIATGRATYIIKEQTFSGLRSLLGSRVDVVGEVTGRVLDILHIVESPEDCLDDASATIAS
jgi:hypothetical protein